MAYKWLAFAVVSVGTFLVTMDMSGLVVALPTLGSIFAEPPETVLWVILAYTLTFTSFMLTAGRIADVVGRKQVFTLGFVIFTLGLVLNSMAQGLWQLVAFRVVQAVGGAMLASNTNAILTTAFPEHERGKALGLAESVVGAGLMLGPVIAGTLLDLLDWRAIFYVRVPVGILGVALAWSILREPARSGQRPRFDPWGALTLSIGLLCLMAAINQGHRIGWTSPAILGLAAAALVLLALFLIVETKVPEPAVDLRLFKNRTFSVYNAILVTFFIPSSSMPFLLPFYLIQGLGAPSAVAGLFLTVIPLLMFILSPGTGTLSDRIGPWVMTTSGLAFQVAGYFLVSRIGEGFSVLQTLLGLGVLGIGAGLFLTPVYSAVMGATPPDRMGLSSALIATLRGIGTTTGQAVAATSLAMRREFHESALPAGLDNLQRVRQGLALGFRDTILILATVAVLGFLIALTLARPRGGQQPTQKELAEARSD